MMEGVILLLAAIPPTALGLFLFALLIRWDARRQ
jgi:hypothetical protein